MKTRSITRIVSLSIALLVSGCANGNQEAPQETYEPPHQGKLAIGPISLTTSWCDNGPNGGKAYRAKFRALPGGHYTTPIDLPDNAVVHSISIAIRRVDSTAPITVALLGAGNYDGEIEMLSEGVEKKDELLLMGPIDVDRYSLNYRLDLNVVEDVGGGVDLVGPPLLAYWPTPNHASP